MQEAVKQGLPIDVISLLEKDEKILYWTRPHKIAAALSRSGGAFLGLLIFLMFSLIIIPVFSTVAGSFLRMMQSFSAIFPGYSNIGTVGKVAGFLPIFNMVVLFLIIFPVALILVLLIWSFLNARNLVYVITNKRLIIRKGAIGVDYDIIDLSYIVRGVYIRRGFVDKIFGTATISILAPAAPMLVYEEGLRYGRAIPSLATIQLVGIKDYMPFYEILVNAIAKRKGAQSKSQ